MADRMHSPAHPKPTLGAILLLGALTATGAMSIDLYLPALPTIAEDFGTSVVHVQGSLSAYFVGMALGQLVYGPLSDRIGRRKPLIAGVFLAMLGAISSGFSTGADWLIASRLVESLGGCAGVVVARAVVSDRYDTVEAAKIFSTLMLVLGMAPLLAPSLGAALLGIAGWRAIFAVLAVFSLLLMVAVILWLPETRSPAMAAASRDEKVWRSYAACFGDRRILGLVLAGACNGGALFVYIASSAALFISHFGVSAQMFGIIFAVNSIGLIGGSQWNRLLLHHFPPQRIVAMASVFALAISTLLLLAALSGFATLWITTALLFAILSTYGLVGSNSMALALSRMPERGGSISALIGSAAFGVGAVASATISMLPLEPPLRVAVGLFVGLAGAMLALSLLVRVREWR